MQRIHWCQCGQSERKAALQRSDIVTDPALVDRVSQILKQVKCEGDVALRALTEQYDGTLPESWQYDSTALSEAGERLSAPLKQAIDTAIKNIRAFHQAQALPPVSPQIAPGIACELRTEPLQRVGLYVPGGSAPLISTVLMLALPAQIAGCELKVMVTPPPVNDAILYAAARCGIDRLYAIGGAQAIAALAYGTEQVPRVDKIFGPGNRFVTEAKRQVSQQGIAIDMPAGPSEVLVIADELANPEFVAADLLSQAEHGADSQAILVTPSTDLADGVDRALKRQLATLPRAQIANAALRQSRTIVAQDLPEAAAISNAYAPEHLIVQTRDPRALLPVIRSAGSIFLGPWTPESVGDYASGTNHVLPTYGAARTVSSLSLADFQRRFTVQELTRGGLDALGDTVITLAQAEGLEGHARAVALRLSANREGSA
ncbi:histidinol dehydrogenase [Ferrimonas gelatinilytica]|uniref:histidinol dehydrogenase n=1 Tax=Ferrimonas gelatinilytica TaxID=1255257 RepID=UPI003CD0A075